eukprot:TRINITY_DN26257_c0_g1_i1.p1 TRINITY_DN26257_c0_g1~~TRINITY_DN26257_c0_g1_i1.p1  ORF type:complete len:2387 (-),score=590.65 TRINITY_DN26257_c0_g1_i1:69-7061(-)
MDGSLAQACLQVLMRSCSTAIGAKALLSYQLKPEFKVSELTQADGTSGLLGLLLLLRLAKQACFQGLLQMVAELFLQLLEEGPILQQRMETEIVGLFGAQRKELPARDVCRQLFHLYSRGPSLFEDALKAVTQCAQRSGGGEQPLTLGLLPEAERPQRPKIRAAASLPSSALPVIQTLVSELCFQLDIQRRTCFSKIHEVAAKGPALDEGEAPLPEGTVPPVYPLALGPNSILYVLDHLLARVHGLGALLLRPPWPTAATLTAAAVPSGSEASDFFVVEASSPAPQKSLLLLMMRHLLPGLSCLNELWPQQIELLRPSQRAALSSVMNPVQRCLPHLGAVLCSAARHPGEPRRVLVGEAVVALKALAEGPKGTGGMSSTQGCYGAQVAAVSALVARLLSAAVATERKEDRDAGGVEEGISLASFNSVTGSVGATAAVASSPRVGGQQLGELSVGMPPAKRARMRKEPSFFNGQGEIQALREAFVSVLGHLDLQKADSTSVATAVVRCLELLSRREASQTHETQEARNGQSRPESQSVELEMGSVRVDPEEEAEDHLSSRFVRATMAARRGEDGEEPEDDEEDDEEDEDEEMGEEAEEGMEDEEDDDGGAMNQMNVGDGPEHHHGEDGDEDEDADYDEEMEDEEDYDGDMGEFGPDMPGSNQLANALQSAIQVFDLDQEMLNSDNMTFHVDIDLGGANAIHGVHRAGQFRRMHMHMPPPPGSGLRGVVGLPVAVNASGHNGWTEPGELDAPADHPLLRRETLAQHSAGDPEGGRMLPWMGSGSLRQLLVAESRGGGSPSSSAGGGAGSSAGGSPASAREGFDTIFGGLSDRLRSVLRTAPSASLHAPMTPVGAIPLLTGGEAAFRGAEWGSQDVAMPPANADVPPPPPPRTPAEDASGEGAESAPASAEALAPPASTPAAEGAPATAPTGGEGGGAADEPMEQAAEEAAPAPMAVEAPAGVAETPAPGAAASGAAPSAEAADAAPPAAGIGHVPAAEPPAAVSVPGAGVGSVDEPNAAASAAAATAASEPPPLSEEEAAAEAAVVALGVVELERLASRLGCRQSEILRAAGIDVSVVAELPEDLRADVIMPEVSQANLDHLRRRPQAAGTAFADGAAAAGEAQLISSDIDAVVLEQLPPEIREEVLREERARQREQQAAAARAEAAAAAGTAGGNQNTEMDNASFVASLDPVLREEVLLSAPEELLRTLPAELVAEAQLLRDRAFTRIAMRREVPPPAWAPHMRGAPAGVAAGNGEAVQVMPGGANGNGGSGGARAGASSTQDWPRHHAQLLLIEQQQLLHQTSSAGSRRWGGLGLRPPVRIASPGAAASFAGLSSFDESDQQMFLKGQFSDFDEGTNADLPLPLCAIPSACRLLYLRQEVAAAPMTRMCFNLSLHPLSRSSLLGHFLVLLCRRSEADAALDTLPPPCLFECLDGRPAQRSPKEVQAVGSQRVLAILAYLLRRLPQCGEFFAQKLQHDQWMDSLKLVRWTDEERRKKARGESLLAEDISFTDLPGHCPVNLLMQLVTTKLYLSSSRHSAWLLSVLHSLLVPQALAKAIPAEDAAAVDSSTAPAGTIAAATQTQDAGAADAAVAPPPPTPEETSQVATADTAAVATAATQTEQQQPGQERWAKIIEAMHGALSKQSVLALCNFLCQAGSGHGSSSEGDAFQLAGDILVALAASRTHLDTVRVELMQVLATLVTDIEKALGQCEAAAAEPSTMESRFLRVVRTLTEVFREASKSKLEQEGKPEGLMEEARVEMLWGALDRTLERLDDTEVTATPAQRLLSSGMAPSLLRGEESSASSNLASSTQAAPPKPLLNRLLPLIEAFFVLHGHGLAEAPASDHAAAATAAKATASVPSAGTEENTQHGEGVAPAALCVGESGEGGSSSSTSKAHQVFAEREELSAAEKSRFGQFCKKHRRPLNALVKQTPALLSKSFAPLLQLMPGCLDFDNKRAYFRSQLRSRRLENRHETIRLRVRRGEIFMDSYHQLRMRTGEELRAKIQVSFQGEEGIDAGGVAKEWYGALAKEIFNPNYALFIQAGGKACTYHPNPMSYVNRDHLMFFHFIGRVIGKAIHDGQNLEAWFTRGFYKHMLGRKVIPADLEAFDPEYFSNLKWMLDHDITDIVELTFSAESDELGERKVVDLKPNGRRLPVTNENKHEYIQLMSEHKMTNSVVQQIEAFLKGLHEIVPAQLLSLFDNNELELLISGLPDIDIEDLKQNTEYHNYTPQSEQVQWFWKVLSEFTQEQRAWFLQFATGTSRVPVEGFKGLVGMRGPQKFSLHRAYGADRLPSAHTCFNQVDLPEYTSEELLREKLLQAVSEGHEGFGFA